MTRRPPRALTRRLALALSLMLIVSSLALPALADEPTAEIISPAEEETVYGDTLYLEAETNVKNATPLGLDGEGNVEGRSDDEPWIAWAVRSPVRGDCDNDNLNIDGDTARDYFDGEKSFVDGLFKAKVDISGLDPEADYCFAFNVANTSARDFVTFTISDELAGFDEGNDEIAQCGEDEECSLKSTNDDGQSFTATVDGNPKDDDEEPSVLGLRIPEAEDAVRKAVFGACEGALAPGQRLAGSVSQLVPVNFNEGNIEVTNFVPKDVIDEDENRGNFQVCIAPTMDEVGEYKKVGYEFLNDGEDPLGEFDLASPILLDRCSDELDTACVESRKRVGNTGLEITYRLPAVDPWMM